MIKIKEVKKIREQFDFTHLVMLGIDKDGMQHIATHGKSVKDANISASIGDHLKKELKWPIENCKSKPIKRVCINCDYWKSNHTPGSYIRDNEVGKCMFEVKPITRYSQDIACGSFSPKD